ncbi:MAG TPA: serine hydrolase domain-containing protein [Nocardioidaceae bacterium]|nr:serine hydrolase domain-containing protein [Nocardioidaceae bacterium]
MADLDTVALDALAAEKGFTGAVQLGEWKAAYGEADRAHRIANTLDTKFGLASGNKAMTALVVMSLVRDGTLSLATTARSLLGEDLPLVDDAVTVEHLLAHRSGIGDYLDEDLPGDIDDYAMTRPVHELDSTEAFVPMLGGFAQKFAPGSAFSYCNGGFIVLALLAERSSGMGYHDLVRDVVLAPSGMVESGFLRSDRLPGDAALGYLEDGRTNVFHLPVLGNGDGGMYSTLADMERFWDALFGGRILPRDVIDEMVAPRSDVPEESGRYGLGFWLDAEGPGVWLTGYDAGASFWSRRDPTTGHTATVMSNTSEGAWPLVWSLRDAADTKS